MIHFEKDVFAFPLLSLSSTHAIGKHIRDSRAILISKFVAFFRSSQSGDRHVSCPSCVLTRSIVVSNATCVRTAEYAKPAVNECIAFANVPNAQCMCRFLWAHILRTTVCCARLEINKFKLNCHMKRFTNLIFMKTLRAAHTHTSTRQHSRCSADFYPLHGCVVPFFHFSFHDYSIHMEWSRAKNGTYREAGVFA